MKKLFAVLIALIGFSAFADEAVLFDSTAKADVLGTGYDWVGNAKTVGLSGCYEAGKNISNPVLNEKYGLSIRTDCAPQYTSSNFAFEFVAPNFNEPNTGAGYIKNAAAVKSMDITLTLNRGYDEVTVVWFQNGKEHKIKFTPKNAANTIQSMTEFTAHIDFTDYVSDVRNRSVKQIPVAGLNMTNIYLKQIVVTTHRAPGTWEYSPTAIVGVKKISAVYDKAVTDEAVELGKEADEVFGIKSTAALEKKTRDEIDQVLRMTDYNKQLMATEDTKAESDAK